MKLTRAVILLTVSALPLVACDTPNPTEAIPPVLQVRAARGTPSPAAPAENLSARDQAVKDALASGARPGAVVDHEAGCFILLGISDTDGNLLAFAGLFPGDQEPSCDPGTFARTNPDGTVDEHMKGTGSMFLLVFDPFASFGSEGSDVDWESFYRGEQGSVLNIRGTLSDGSRVRAHFVNNPTGPVASAGQLWVEALGWVARPGKSGK